jgi:K+/H+ antiporter YhaU regulatory subunit KhtT
MANDVQVHDLYGIGKRYDVGCSQGQRVVVVIRKDGYRELYSFEKGATEPTAVITLSDEQSRRLGAILTGAFLDAAG